jgi:hypothetical protein
MEEPLKFASAQVGMDKGDCGGWRGDLYRLLVLVLLVAGLRAWQISHTEVTSRDSIGYIRIAWHLQHEDWREFLPRASQHPGYPVTILAAAWPVHHLLHADLPVVMQVSAQLATGLASILLVLPMYFLGRYLFGRGIAFWACLLFQCLPSAGRVLGDGLSDGLFLFFATMSLWLALLAFRYSSPVLFALTGLFGGLAYLVRPEGALLLGATGLVLLGSQIPAGSRRPWKKFLIAGVALTLTGLAVMAPYMVVIRGITVKNTPNILMHTQRPEADWEGDLRPQQPTSPAPAPNQQSLGTVPSAPLLAIWWVPTEEEVEYFKQHPELPVTARIPTRYVWAAKAVLVELNKGFFHFAWLPALLGLWWCRDLFRRVPGLWVLPLVCLLLTALLYRVAQKMGYLSDRHLLLIILCGSYWAVAGVGVFSARWASGLVRLWPALAQSRWGMARNWAVALLLALLVLPLIRTLGTLHADRAGFRTLGSWLAEHVAPGDFIEDPYCWATYYAGRVFLEGAASLPASQPPCYYVILEQARSQHTHLVSLAAALLHVGEGRKPIYVHEAKRGKDRVKILVYKVPGPYVWMALPGLPGT